MRPQETVEIREWGADGGQGHGHEAGHAPPHGPGGRAVAHGRLALLHQPAGRHQHHPPGPRYPTSMQIRAVWTQYPYRGYDSD